MKLIKINLKKIGFDYQKIGEAVSVFWTKWHNVIFFIIFLVISGIGFYFFYAFIYRSEWSDAKKNEYSQSKEKNIEFKEAQFVKLVGLIEEKNRNLVNEWKPIKDIFQPYR